MLLVPRALGPADDGGFAVSLEERVMQGLENIRAFLARHARPTNDPMPEILGESGRFLFFFVR